METVTVSRGQTIYDLALQAYGSADAVFLLMEDNDNTINMDTVFAGGEKLKVKQPPLDKFVKEYFENNNLKPVSKQDDNEGNITDFNPDFNFDF